MAQLGARLDGIEEVVGSNPIGSTNFGFYFQPLTTISKGQKGAEPLGDNPIGLPGRTLAEYSRHSPELYSPIISV